MLVVCVCVPFVLYSICGSRVWHVVCCFLFMFCVFELFLFVTLSCI